MLFIKLHHSTRLAAVWPHTKMNTHHHLWIKSERTGLKQMGPNGGFCVVRSVKCFHQTPYLIRFIINIKELTGALWFWASSGQVALLCRT